MTMNRTLRIGGLLLASVAWLALAGSPQAQQRPILGGDGKGAPQAEHCKSVGGSMSGAFCVLEGGSSCDAMTLARDGVCKGPDGEIIEEEEDTGSNDDGSNDDGGEEGGGDDAGGGDAGGDSGGGDGGGEAGGGEGGGD